MKPNRRVTSGYILLEVLVTIVILAIGLLGLAGFQARATVAESEGYQRAQALILAQDMVDRIYANRINAATYVQNDIGVPATVTNCTTPPLSGKAKDVCEWGNLLIGASEAVGGSNVGTLLGGRGCVTAGGANEYFVTVAWQGLISTVSAGNAGAAACGFNQYKDQSGATNDAMRRVVAMRVVISTLSNIVIPP